MLVPTSLFLLSCCCCFLQHTESLVVPQELPSVLSVVYSNIPPIKKGTDSRLGFGFRLGEHADFQMLVELGPQKATRPIGGTSEENSSFRKRQVSAAEQKAWLRRQQLKEQAEQLTSTERNAANWLQNWSKDVSASKKKTKSKQRGVGKKQIEKDPVNLMPTMPVLPAETLKQLQLLYKWASTTTEAPSHPTKTQSTPTRLPQLAIDALQTPDPVEFMGPDQLMQQQAPRKTKTEITKELMDVSME